MAKFADRVHQTTTSTGTGTINLDGSAVTGKQTFSNAFTTGDVVYYCITDGTNWEVGTGTLTTGSPWTLSRTAIASSNANALVSFSAGSKDVFCTQPASFADSTALLNVNQLFTKAQSFSVVALSVSVNAIAVDLALSNTYSVTLQASTSQVLSNPTNAVAGTSGVIAITQNATPSLLTFASYWKSLMVTPAVSTTAGAVTLLSYYVVDATNIWFSLSELGSVGTLYPSAGLAYSTGTAWGTSYTTSGTGTVVALANSPTFITPVLGTPTSGDFSTGTFTWPTFNQNTSGSAATLTTPRAIYGNNFDGSAALTQVIASTYGGTGNGFTAFTGPTTAEKTFTLPNSSATLLYDGGALGTPSGGTLSNCTGLPVSTGISGLGTNVATWLATPTSANLAAAITDETGTTGSLVFSAAPTFTGLLTATFASISGPNGTNGNMLAITGTQSFNASASQGIHLAPTLNGSTSTLAQTMINVAGSFVPQSGATISYVAGLVMLPVFNSTIIPTSVYGAYSGISFAAGATGGTVTTARNFYAAAPAFSTATTNITNYQQYYAADVANGSGNTITNKFGFYSDVTSGTGKWGFYSNGSANNAFAGNTRFGGITAPSATLDVTGTISSTGAATIGGGIDNLTTASGVVSVAASAAPSSGYLLTATSATTATWQAPPNGMVYPGAGIANSTGSAWGTSYSVSGTGDVALTNSPTFITPVLGTPTSGDFSTGTFTWPTFNQNTSGYAEALKSATTTVTVSAATAPTIGQVLTATSGTAADWQTPGGGATLSDDTTTNATRYPTYADATSGTMSTAYVSSSKLTFNPSTGTLSATVMTTLSDLRVKKNIQRIENATSTIKEVDGVSFQWRDTDRKSYGFIAQELEKIIPDLVITSEDTGFKTVNYSGLIGFLVNAVKEMDERIKVLEAK